MARRTGGVQDAAGGVGCRVVPTAELVVEKKAARASRPKHGLEVHATAKKSRGSSRNRSPAYARE